MSRRAECKNGNSAIDSFLVISPSYMRWYKHSVVIIEGEKWVLMYCI